MARNYELDFLKSREQEAFHRKQAAYQQYMEAKARTSEAYDDMQSAWDERCSAREEMNSEYEAMQRSSENYREVWDEYGRIRDTNNSRIESLRYEADSEHQMMKDCFDRASDAYEYGDKSEAPIHSAEGHEHKERRDALNEEIKALAQEIRDAKATAEWRAPKTDSSAFHRAKDNFQRAKARHESAQADFKRLKAERDRLKREFDAAKEEHEQLKEEFQRKLAEVKANNQRERDRTLDKAGVRYSERKDAKIVKKADGTTQVYHGGIGSGDGLGHGHTALDQFGNKTYDRGAFEKHGKQNFKDSNPPNGSLGTKRSHGGWTPIERGTIFDEHGKAYDVTFRTGLGGNEGQTLIKDGHDGSNNEFHKHHNHYGDSDKGRFPNEPDRIEDSSKHKNDKYYTGPGH